jgi:Ca2+-binding EF-hand superfamily protein
MAKTMIRSCCSLIGVVCAAFALGHLASAADTKPGQQASFESLDKNSDGKVSINEATEHDGLFVAFKNLDKDKDGNLTKEEFASYRAAR